MNMSTKVITILASLTINYQKTDKKAQNHSSAKGNILC